MCAPHHEGWDTIHGVAKGVMDLGLYQCILDGLVADELRFDHVIFQWLGDPSLHPELPRMIRMAADTLGDRVGYLRVDTNAIRLPPARMDALLEAARPELPLLLVFTLDAHTPATYTRVKGSDSLERVRGNIQHLIRARRERGGDCALNIQLQFVVQDGNEGEAGDFLAYWSGLLDGPEDGHWHDEVLFKRLSVGGGAEGQARADALYEHTMARFSITPGRVGGVHVQTWSTRPWQEDDAHSGGRTACPGLWLTPVIRHDGNLMMCCADLGGELNLGSLADHGFRDLWEGEKATRRRIDHIAGRFEGVCKGCGGINWYETTTAMKRAAKRRAKTLGLVAQGRN
jgi:MoaA/NifB/PqqE/SkfB family radical SAM enzyme